VYRIGKAKANFNRQVKVRFDRLSDRNLAWSNRLNSKHPIYLNEDLPLGMRREEALLRSKIRELKDNKVKFEVIWIEKLINSKRYSYKIINGVLMQKELQSTLKSNFIPQSKRSDSIQQNQDVPNFYQVHNILAILQHPSQYHYLLSLQQHQSPSYNISTPHQQISPTHNLIAMLIFHSTRLNSTWNHKQKFQDF